MLNGESSHKDEGECGCLLNAPCAILNSSLPHGQDWHTPAFIFQATVLKCREIILAAFWTETLKHTKQHIPGGKENPHGHPPSRHWVFRIQSNQKRRHECSMWKKGIHMGRDQGRLKVSLLDKHQVGIQLTNSHRRPEEQQAKQNSGLLSTYNSPAAGEKVCFLKGHREGAELGSDL